MGIIGSTIQPFKATAFQAGKDFFDVTEKDLDGKWAVFFFYPADFTFVCPTELQPGLWPVDQPPQFGALARRIFRWQRGGSGKRHGADGIWD